MRKGSSAPRTKRGRLGGTLIPVACATDDCPGTSVLAYPGEGPYQGGMFLEKGWLSMSEPESPAVLYLCPKCAAEEVAAADAEIARLSKKSRRKVSG